MLDDAIRKIFPGFHRAAKYESRDNILTGDEAGDDWEITGVLVGPSAIINGRPVPVSLCVRVVATGYGRASPSVG